jgi:hypothetical protein
MKTAKTVDIRSTIADLIREKRQELGQLENAMSALGGIKPNRKRRPSDDAIQSRKVTTGGRLVGFRDKIVEQLSNSSEPMTVKDLTNALYDRGLGVTKAKMRTRIASTIQHMKADETIRSKKNGQGRTLAWTINRKGAKA